MVDPFRRVADPAAGLPDAQNPAARAYARQALMHYVQRGLLPRYLPQWDADPTAAWRAVSAMFASSPLAHELHAGAGHVPPVSRAAILAHIAPTAEQAARPAVQAVAPAAEALTGLASTGGAPGFQPTPTPVSPHPGDRLAELRAHLLAALQTHAAHAF